MSFMTTILRANGASGQIGVRALLAVVVAFALLALIPATGLGAS